MSKSLNTNRMGKSAAAKKVDESQNPVATNAKPGKPNKHIHKKRERGASELDNPKFASKDLMLALIEKANEKEENREKRKLARMETIEKLDQEKQAKREEKEKKKRQKLEEAKQALKARKKHKPKATAAKAEPPKTTSNTIKKKVRFA